MRKPFLLAAALLALECGGTNAGPDFNQNFPDPAEGAVDFSVLNTAPLPPDAKGTSPAVCGTKRCYYASQAQVAGEAMMLVAFDPIPAGTSPAPVLTDEGVTISEFDFPQGCAATGTFDPVQDSYRPDQQDPVFDSLPMSSTLPLVRPANVGGLTQWSCQDFKSADSVNASEEGALVTALSPEKIYFRPVIDQTAFVKPSKPDFWTPLHGWWNRLQLAYLDGGEVPVDDAGNLVAMQGALLDLTAGTQSKLTDANVIVLPAKPGDPGYSPLVELHEFTVGAGRSASSYTNICATPGNCRPNEVDPSQWSAAASFTLFVVVGQ